MHDSRLAGGSWRWFGACTPLQQQAHQGHITPATRPLQESQAMKELINVKAALQVQSGGFQISLEPASRHSRCLSIRFAALQMRLRWLKRR